jgi:hypothetical protein
VNVGGKSVQRRDLNRSSAALTSPIAAGRRSSGMSPTGALDVALRHAVAQLRA